MTALVQQAREAVEALGTLPHPGGGATAKRWEQLAAVGANDLSVARLVEPHVDAVSILAEAGRAAHPDELYGVWASKSATPVTLHESRRGALELSGLQPFCGGAMLCTRALVNVVDVRSGAPTPTMLIDLDLDAARSNPTVIIDQTTWRSSTFSETATSDVVFTRHRVNPEDLVGPADFYLQRPGFWHGAIGPAAVWSGGARGLVESAEHYAPANPHGLGARGELRSLSWAMAAQLRVAGAEADASPEDVRAARTRAIMVRHLIERQSTRVVDLFSQAVGPRPFVRDEAIIRRVAELQLYLRQVHFGTDLELIGQGEVA